jgi:cell division septation protein DedD
MMMRKLGLFSMAATGLALVLLAGCSRESSDWKSAQAADTPEAYQEFLRQHPSGSNASQAQARIKQLAEDRDWQLASSADTRDAYEQFVAQHADSKWAQEARIRIENFAQGGSSGVPGAPISASGAGTAASPTGPAATPAPAPAPAKAAAATHPSAHTASVARTASKPKTAAKSPAKSSTASAGSHTGSHYVQLGAFSSKARAQSQWKQLQARFPTQLATLTPRYLPSKTSAKSVYRLQVALPSADQARELCNALKKHSQACVAAT